MLTTPIQEQLRRTFMVATEEPGTSDPEWTLGDRFRKAREFAGFKQEDLAKFLGVSPATISNWETGARLPRGGELNLISRWSKITGVRKGWFTDF
jgi:DNA-binding transcriptional regulator YiaG